MPVNIKPTPFVQKGKNLHQIPREKERAVLSKCSTLRKPRQLQIPGKDVGSLIMKAPLSKWGLAKSAGQ